MTTEQLILVQFKGMNDSLDAKIVRLAKQCRLNYDGAGYAFQEHFGTPAGTREHFIYGSDKANIAKFRSAVVKLARGISVKVRPAAPPATPKVATRSIKRVGQPRSPKKGRTIHSRLTRARRSD